MVQIGTFTTSEGTHLLKVVQAGLCQAQILQTDRQTQVPQQGKELAMSLGREAVATQALLQPQLHQEGSLTPLVPFKQLCW